MKKLISTLVAVLFSAVVSGEVIWEKTYKDPELQKEYYVNHGGFTLEKITQPQKVRISVKAAGEGKLGVRLRIYPQQGKAEFRGLFWNIALKKGGSEISRVTTFDVDTETMKRIEVYTYKIGKNATLRVESLKVSDADAKQGAVLLLPKTKRKTYTEYDYKPGFFPTGAYLYLGSREFVEKTLAPARGLNVEQYFDTIFSDMRLHGCTAVYIANITTDPGFFKYVCKKADQYGLKVFAQGTGELYVRTKNDRKYFERVTVPAIRKYLHHYNDIPNLVGYTCKEEVQPAAHDMALMKDGRRLSKEQMPKIPAFTLHNNIKSMELDNGDDIPEWFGFDRYRFRMVLNGKGKLVISTPSDMVRLLSRELDEMYQFAAARKRPLIYVGQGYIQYEEKESTYLSEATGYKKLPNGKWSGFHRYMPKNGMHLQFWLALSQGCRGFLIFYYQGRAVGERSSFLVDLKGKESWFWKEIGECFNMNKSMFPLFANWCREGDPAAVSPDKDVQVNTFIVPGFKGRFVVPVNTRIATWDKNNPYRTDKNTQLHAGEYNLEGFTWASARKITLRLADKGELRDYLTGKMVDPGEIILPPGQGRVFFEGTEAEYKALKKHFKQ